FAGEEARTRCHRVVVAPAHEGGFDQGVAGGGTTGIGLPECKNITWGVGEIGFVIRIVGGAPKHVADHVEESGIGPKTHDVGIAVLGRVIVDVPIVMVAKKGGEMVGPMYVVGLNS